MKKALSLSALLWSACANGPAQITSTQPVTLQPVAWDADMTAVGKLQAITELEDDVIVYGDQGAYVFAGGAMTASDGSVTTWRTAATIPAADGSGAWAIGLDGKGHLYRLRARMWLEDVTDRYGLLGTNVLGLASLGGTRVAFALDGGVALADGLKVVRFDEGPLTGIAGSGKRAAGVAPDGSVRILDSGSGQTNSYPLGDAVAVAFGLDGSLLALTKHRLYQEDMQGLKLIYQDSGSTFHGLAVSGAWVWIGAGGDLLGWNGSTMSRTRGMALPPDATLVPSASGDAWVLSGGALHRFTVPVTGDEATWRNTVLPVYARVCSACHAPGGTSGIELSTYQQWVDRRPKIYMRVIVKGDMPQGRTLPDADKAALAAWATPPSK